MALRNTDELLAEIAPKNTTAVVKPLKLWNVFMEWIAPNSVSGFIGLILASVASISQSGPVRRPTVVEAPAGG